MMYLTEFVAINFASQTGGNIGEGSPAIGDEYAYVGGFGDGGKGVVDVSQAGTVG